MTPMPASTVISAAGAGTAHEIASNANTPARFNQLLMVLPPIISLADFIADFVAQMEPPGPASRRPDDKLKLNPGRADRNSASLSRITLRSIRASGYGSVSHRLIDFVRRARRDRVSVHHEQHGETGVLAHQCDQFDDAALADERRHRLEVGVAYLPGREKLGDEVIRRRFIRRHTARPFAGRQGRDKRRTEARIQRLLAVRI